MLKLADYPIFRQFLYYATDQFEIKEVDFSVKLGQILLIFLSGDTIFYSRLYSTLN